MGKDISVIIPTWMVRDTLCDCLDSVLSQRHIDMEIIIVNREGTDGTEDIIREYATQYDCIRPIFLPSDTCLAEQRNRGIKEATGEYIAFCDSDDLLPKDNNIYFSMVGIAKKANADMVVGNFYRERNGELIKDRNDKKGIQRCLERLNVAFWNKIFRTKFIHENDIIIPSEINTFEDAVFCVEVLLKSPKIVGTDRYVYIYREQRENDPDANQTSKDRRLERVLCDFRALEWVCNQSFTSDDSLWKEFFWNMLTMVFWFTWIPMRNLEEKKKAYGELQEVVKRIQHVDSIGRIATNADELRFHKIFGMNHLDFISLPYEQFVLFRMLKGQPTSVGGPEEGSSPQNNDFVLKCYAGEIGMKTILKCIKGWASYKFRKQSKSNV